MDRRPASRSQRLKSISSRRNRRRASRPFAVGTPTCVTVFALQLALSTGFGPTSWTVAPPHKLFAGIPLHVDGLPGWRSSGRCSLDDGPARFVKMTGACECLCFKKSRDGRGCVSLPRVLDARDISGPRSAVRHGVWRKDMAGCPDNVSLFGCGPTISTLC